MVSKIVSLGNIVKIEYRSLKDLFSGIREGYAQARNTAKLARGIADNPGNPDGMLENLVLEEVMHYNKVFRHARENPDQTPDPKSVGIILYGRTHLRTHLLLLQAVPYI
ncbi:hypothetical protein JW711_00280 [Candidatus Woesearchaeota archaeon]|nr:hypothetical protein [Candidatus Woesearchaeota archaeon]